MDPVTIPSPSAFLSSPVTQSAKLPPPTSAAQKRKATTAKASASTSKTSDGVTKLKQSKSRNGCITCKAKRLKCDETKPSCQQCHKRSVTCGGYKKDFKWRPFEEATFTNKPASPRTKRSYMSPVKTPDPGQSESHSTSDGSPPNLGADVEAGTPIQDNFFPAISHSPPGMHVPNTSFPNQPFQGSMSFDSRNSYYAQTRSFDGPYGADGVTSPFNSLFEDPNLGPFPTGRPSMSGQSPRLIDLLLPGSELNARPAVQSLPLPQSLPTPVEFHSDNMSDPLMEEDVEEVIREPQDFDPWHSRGQTRNHLSYNSRSDTPISMGDEFSMRIYRQPEVQAGSPEMLIMRFDKQTCGILSIKDGPTENPWRTLIWPLARDSPALYHAIASMTAFHTSKEKPALRVDGMEHMRRSIRSLATGIEKMRTDTALATTLVLAFSESWDQHISTGIEHLRGARILVNQALTKHSRNPINGEDLARLRFLCNTWVYMDVIARLTSIDDNDSTDFETILAPLQTSSEFQSTEIDPLMGCATTLFPVIGRVANLCRKVRTTESNSVNIISQAIELKEQIEQWEPGTDFEVPEDPYSEIQHSLQTAEAYRYATLLYLHQAVPEIPSLSSAALARKVLIYLATVPLSSRVVIVQIYPLLAAGCEAYESEDRQWVEDRWTAMSQRMWIGNIDKCLVVTKEVWNRRDKSETVKEEKSRQTRVTFIDHESSKRKFKNEQEDDIFSFSEMLDGNNAPMLKRSRIDSNMTYTSGSPRIRKKSIELMTEEMDPEMTVRGRLHWVGVMKDWRWEILLG